MVIPMQCTICSSGATDGQFNKVIVVMTLVLKCRIHFVPGGIGLANEYGHKSFGFFPRYCTVLTLYHDCYFGPECNL